MKPTVKALTLDLDDTLWPVRPVLENAERKLHAWLHAHAPAMSQAFPRERFATYRREVARERPDIAHDMTVLRRTALAQALATHGHDPALAATAMEIFLAARQEVEFYPDALPALQRLASRYPLVALTNGNADVHRIGLARYFVAAFSAGAVGAPKPHAKIYHAACAHLGLAAGAVLHVGDDPELDVRGARRAGLHVAWINRTQALWEGDDPAGEFADLGQLCDWLGV